MQIYKIILPPSVHLSRKKSTKHGHEVNLFSMDWGDVTGGQR